MGAAKRAIEGFIERNDRSGARAELEKLPDDVVRADPELLAFKVRLARDEAEAVDAFRAMMNRGDADVRVLSQVMPEGAGAEFAQWVEAHTDQLTPDGAAEMLERVPLHCWSDELLYAVLIRGDGDRLIDEFEPLLAEVEQRSPLDPRLPELRRRAEATRGRLRARLEVEEEE